MDFGMIILNHSIKTEQNCYMDADSFVIHSKTEDFYKDIANDVEKWFDISNYDENDKRPLSIGENEKVFLFGLFKDELGEKILKEFVALIAKTYVYLIDYNSEYKKAKGTRTCVIKTIHIACLMIKSY